MKNKWSIYVATSIICMLFAVCALCRESIWSLKSYCDRPESNKAIALSVLSVVL